MFHGNEPDLSSGPDLAQLRAARPTVTSHPKPSCANDRERRTPMTLLKDLIDIPEQVHKGDFVLKLAEGVQHPTETLRDYVITEQIRTAFDQALGLIKSSLDGKQSKAAFLHGSFGSGKSHFLAVLHLLLAHDATARSHPDLAPIVKKHAWLEGKKFLLVPYHMLGEDSLEQAILGQYVAHVKALHPTAPLPAVFVGEPILRQAESLRETMGDDRFLPALGVTGGLLLPTTPWTLERYHRARTAGPETHERRELISAIVGNLLQSFAGIVGRKSSEGFIGIDEGLGVLSAHAKSLGYDAIMLSLDEVILWLASMISDQAFVTREGTKLAKLIEFQAQRPIPIISLLVRQRDLRELVGEHLPGAEKMSALDALNWLWGRFSTVSLEDRNLPVIVEKRLLRPKSDFARGQIDAAFEETKKLRQEIRDILRTSTSGEEDFRRVYPFSPALIQALVAASALLQRERTAIKVLMQLLVEQRDTLQLGQLVPVGDLMDAIADGDAPFSDVMRIPFEACKKLYNNKLRPRICRDQGISWEQMEALPKSDPKRLAFQRDDRLVKTLLLSALTPEVEALRNMTALKLVALNHGTFRSQIPGQEASQVLSKLRNWGADIGEIRFEGDPRNPTINLELVGVDTAVILDKARHNDNAGNRKVKVRELLFGRLGIEWQDTLEVVHEHMWRGTKRRLAIVYGNVREMVPPSLRSRDDDWKLVIDFPFDEEGHEPQEDLGRVEEFRSKEGSSRTVCWLPAFLSRERQDDLGTLVALDYALASESRFHELAGHLPPLDRTQAKGQLESQRNMLKNRIGQAIEAAYGLGNEEQGMLGAALPVAERFQCLLGGTRVLRRPDGANLGAAMANLCDQMLQLQYPKHPEFPIDVKPVVLKRVYEWVQKAARAEMNRVVVDKERRAEVRAIVDPLRLGQMHEDALVVSHNWTEHFQRQHLQSGGGPITVQRLREWTDKPEPRGLPADVQDLVILTYAELQNLRFFLHGGAVATSLDRRLPDELELKPQPLPSKESYLAARQHAAEGFGVDAGEVHGAANVGLLFDGVRAVAQLHVAPARQVAIALRERMTALGIPFQETPRGRTALSVQGLLEALDRSDLIPFIDRLASHLAPSSWEAWGTSMRQSSAVVQVLLATRWATLANAFALAGAFAAEAKALRDQVVKVLTEDELTTPLVVRLQAIQAAAEELISKALKVAPAPAATPATPPPAASPPLPQPLPPGAPKLEPKGSRNRLDASGVAHLAMELQQKLAKDGGTVSVTWTIEK